MKPPYFSINKAFTEVANEKTDYYSFSGNGSLLDFRRERHGAKLVGTWNGTLDAVAYQAGYFQNSALRLRVQNQQTIDNVIFFRGTMTFSTPFDVGNNLPVTGFVQGKDTHLTGDFFHGGATFLGTSLSGFLHFQDPNATAIFTLEKAP